MKRIEATRAYLDHTSRMTLWSFIKYVARKTNPNTARRFRRTMRAELLKMHEAGEVVRCKSTRGKTAYRRLSLTGNDVPF